jgi:RNA polymerase subunit RPABC4/transcription elongation factor Spt4
MMIVSVIGLIFAIVMVILFFNAAPARSNIPDHHAYTDAKACLECHLVGNEDSPTMPHLNLGKCHYCHRLTKSSPENKARKNTSD